MNLSLLEFLVYGIICYSGVIVLVVSVIKEVPTTRSLAIIRAIYLMPCIIAAGILASTGVDITMDSVTTNNTIRSVNTTQVWTEVQTQTAQFTLLGNFWIPFHMMLFIVMLVYVMQQILFLLTKQGKDSMSDGV